MKRSKKNHLSLLIFAVFLHIFSLICSVYKENYGRFHRCKEINYWFNFLAWWCVQASVVTIIYLIYRLFKKSKENYFDKVFELIVINANIISIGLFSLSALLHLFSRGKIQALPWAKKDRLMYVFPVGEIMANNFWLFYVIIWHYLAPILTITYFVRRKTSLAKTYFERRTLFLYSFIHPLLYTALVFLRPLIPGSQNYPYGGSENPSQHPYFFFDWIASNNFKHIFWASMVIFFVLFWVFIFWFATLFFWNYARIKLEKKGN